MPHLQLEDLFVTQHSTRCFSIVQDGAHLLHGATSWNVLDRHHVVLWTDLHLWMTPCLPMRVAVRVTLSTFLVKRTMIEMQMRRNANLPAFSRTSHALVATATLIAVDRIPRSHSTKKRSGVMRCSSKEWAITGCAVHRRSFNTRESTCAPIRFRSWYLRHKKRVS